MNHGYDEEDSTPPTSLLLMRKLMNPDDMELESGPDPRRYGGGPTGLLSQLLHGGMGGFNGFHRAAPAR